MTDETDPQPKQSRMRRWLEEMEERRARHRDRGALYRIAFAVAGVLVTLAGVIMLVTPGPAFVLIPLGLAMLAMEFAWAEAALEKAVLQAEKASEAAKEADTKQKVATAVGIVLIVAAVVAAIFYWDITVPILNPAD